MVAWVMGGRVGRDRRYALIVVTHLVVVGRGGTFHYNIKHTLTFFLRRPWLVRG